jgi:hypothetical protein
VYVYLLLFTHAHFVIGPWAIELAHKLIRIELNYLRRMTDEGIPR